MSAAKIGFTRKKVKSLTLGEKLQRLRMRRRVSLGEVSKHTKIQVKYLEALEEGHYEQLPADVYVRGFLRSYAQYFNISGKPLVRLYERERGIHETISHEQEGKEMLDTDAKSFLQPKRFVITPKIIIAVVGTLCFFGVGAFLYGELDRFVSSPWLVIDEPIDGTTIDAQQVVIRGTSDPQARVFINEQRALIGSDGVFVEEVGINSGANTITVRSVNSFDKESVQTRTIYGQEDSERGQEQGQGQGQEIEEGEQYDGAHVELRTGGVRVWLSISVDGEEVYSKIADPDTKLTFDGEERVSVTAGVGNQVFVAVNGRTEEALSDVVGLVTDQEFVKEVVEEVDQEVFETETEAETEDGAITVDISEQLNNTQSTQ